LFHWSIDMNGDFALNHLVLLVLKNMGLDKAKQANALLGSS